MYTDTCHLLKPLIGQQPEVMMSHQWLHRGGSSIWLKSKRKTLSGPGKMHEALRAIEVLKAVLSKCKDMLD